MNIFLAASEHQCLHNYVQETNIRPINHLFSYFYIQQKKMYEDYLFFKSKSERILIDSGAHTFHTAKDIDFTEFTVNYSNFIKQTDTSNVVGYFEMDIDNRIGFKNVLKLRKIIEEVTDKVIPVWHKNRGFKKFKRMCSNYDYVSISCLPIEGIPDHDLIKFANVAHDYDCKIHGLGGTRKFILNNVPFDSVDSASWLFSAVNGRYKSKHIDRNSLTYCEKLVLSLLDWRKKQRYYEKYWNEKNKRLKNGKI
jgi:hypothetical protein